MLNEYFEPIRPNLPVTLTEGKQNRVCMNALLQFLLRSKTSTGWLEPSEPEPDFSPFLVQFFQGPNEDFNQSKHSLQRSWAEHRSQNAPQFKPSRFLAVTGSHFCSFRIQNKTFHTDFDCDLPLLCAAFQPHSPASPPCLTASVSGRTPPP